MVIGLGCMRLSTEPWRDPVRGRLFRKLFFTEASLAGKLEHPHIAQIYDAGIGEDSGYIVMEYVPGGTMELYCAPDHLLGLEQVVEIIFKCTRALAYAHMLGVTHRDIKPGNILYSSAPTDVRISDFGLALNIGAETTQITGVGSPAYMSPEQIREELVDHRTDLYSLGVVMYQMLTGVLPFRGTNKYAMIYQITQHEPPPSAERQQVPAALDRIVRRAMHKDAAKRYQSGDEFAEDLIAALRAGTEIIVATPGRLLDLMQRAHVDFSQLEIAVLDEADRIESGGLTGLRFEPPVEIAGVFPKLGRGLRGRAESHDQPGRVPRRAGGQTIALKQHDVFPAHVREMIGHR